MKKIVCFISCLLVMAACSQKKGKDSGKKDTTIEKTRQRQEEHELIKVSCPSHNDTISSNIKIEGVAKGYWFFEATAPVVLMDKNEKIIAETYIEATEDWMTEDFVPFEAQLEYEATGTEWGFLVFRRANASGLQENDDEYIVPVYFQ